MMTRTAPGDRLPLRLPSLAAGRHTSSTSSRPQHTQRRHRTKRAAQCPCCTANGSSSSSSHLTGCQRPQGRRVNPAPHRSFCCTRRGRRPQRQRRMAAPKIIRVLCHQHGKLQIHTRCPSIARTERSSSLALAAAVAVVMPLRSPNSWSQKSSRLPAPAAPALAQQAAAGALLASVPRSCITHDRTAAATLSLSTGTPGTAAPSKAQPQVQLSRRRPPWRGR